MGGGGGVDIPQRNLSQELQQIFKQGLPLDEKAYKKWWQNEPLLSASHDFALNNLQNVGQLTSPLMSLFGQIPGQFGSYIGQLGGLYGNLGGLQGGLRDLQGNVRGLYNQTGALAPGLQRTLANLPAISGLTNPLEKMLTSLTGVYGSQIAPVLNTGGALTDEQLRNAQQQSRAAYAARGNVMSNRAVLDELATADQFRRERFNQALSQGLGISGEERGLTSGIESLRSQDAATRLGLTQGIQGLYGQQGGLAGLLSQLTGQRAGLYGQQAGILGQQAGLTGMESGLMGGLASGIQGLQGGALNQALGTEQAQVGTYATLINPLLAYAGNLNESNQNAAAASSIAGANKSSGALGGGLGLLGSIAMGAGTAL